MKLVKEYINEKFTDESDPIQDMGIGTSYKIKKWLAKHYITKYTINNDSTIDVNGDIIINGEFKNFPKYIKFNHVYGNFSVHACDNLTNLSGCPKIIEKDFNCMGTNITSLVGGPEIVYADYMCTNCFNLTSLKGIAKHIYGSLYCRHISYKVFTQEDLPSYCKIEKNLYNE